MTTHRAQQYKPGDFSLGQVHEFLGAFGRQGGTPELLQAGIEDEMLMNCLVRYWASGGYEATTAQRAARAIMGTNFFGIEEATRHFGIEPTEAQLAAFAEIPFTEGELQECKDTHILVAVFPMSIIDIRKKVERTLFYSQEGAWYDAESFAKKKGRVQWYLILKEPVPNLISKTWKEQQGLLNENEEIPEVRCMAYTIMGHYLATGERLFETTYVRCANGVYIGLFSKGGLSFRSDSAHAKYRGPASARKPRS